jgi:hypothetical protein
MKKLFGGVKYANVAATLALVAALFGGVALAAEMAKRNTVESKAIVNDEVKAKDLAEHAVEDDEVLDLSQAAEAITLLNGWEADDTAVISKTNDGVVRLDGTIDGVGSTSNDAFTLPAGSRPAADAIMLAGCGGGQTAVLSINSQTGNVNVSGSPACFNLVTLTGISFTSGLTPIR